MVTKQTHRRFDQDDRSREALRKDMIQSGINFIITKNVGILCTDVTHFDLQKIKLEAP